MNEIRVLIIDDESHARRGLRSLLAEEKDFAVVGEACDGDEAVDKIRKHDPDLVFLDVEMPRRNGLEIVDEIGAERMPHTVFVTAYDQYAVSAFKVDAVDYLLKPFTDERFGDTLRRARHALSGNGSPRREPLRRFTVKAGDKLEVHRVDEIDWIEADEYYVKLHIGGQAYMIRQTMSTLEEQLPSDAFARIHRSSIVNLNRIVALEPLFQGDYTVVLHDGTQLRMSRRRSEVLSGLLKSFS